MNRRIKSVPLRRIGKFADLCLFAVFQSFQPFENRKMGFQRQNRSTHLGVTLQKLRDLAVSLARRHHRSILTDILYVHVAKIRLQHIPGTKGIFPALQEVCRVVYTLD